MNATRSGRRSKNGTAYCKKHVILAVWVPMVFREAYPDAVFQSINPSNYTEFVSCINNLAGDGDESWSLSAIIQYFYVSN